MAFNGIKDEKSEIFMQSNLCLNPELHAVRRLTLEVCECLADVAECQCHGLDLPALNAAPFVEDVTAQVLHCRLQVAAWGERRRLLVF